MTAYYNEIDPFAAAWLRELIKAGLITPGEVDERSIEDVTPNELAGFTQCHFFAGIGVWSYALRSAGWPDDRPVWTGSCPCQPFSAAGKGDGFADERHLWPSFNHLIAQCRPPIVFGEQVASKAADDWIDLVHADLEAVGYAFGCVPFPSAGVGAPHIRDRNYWVADTDEQQRHGGGNVWTGGRSESANSRTINGLGDTSYTRLSQQPGERGAPCEEGGTFQGKTAERTSTSIGGVADTHFSGAKLQLGDAPETARFPQDECQPEHNADVSERSGANRDEFGSVRGDGLSNDATRPGPTNGFWRDADWLFCRDGKWRPVEPGTFPLVAGSSRGMVQGSNSGVPFDANKTGEARVMRLRGYGNAINAVAAQSFIEAFLGV